ncbi:putative ORFan [Tupanvirus deep ocean]|uniref:ORFan n=2 Tax=Tupanvirus TaxID=2094720 RepID=A0AC62AAE8_9VIRU|nr:putative ORFan [Tupanvirus deep ocean]QKU34618.1 putative ORFan [Tupanvirus deep ocean]
MSSQYNYCCQQIDNPNNKWRDCNPCENMKPYCTLLLNENDCNNGILSKYCQWSNNKCVLKPDAPQFAQYIDNCNENFSQNRFCSPTENSNALSGLTAPSPSKQILNHSIAPPTQNAPITQNAQSPTQNAQSPTQYIPAPQNAPPTPSNQNFPDWTNINPADLPGLYLDSSPNTTPGPLDINNIPDNTFQPTVNTAPKFYEYFNRWSPFAIIILFVLVIYLLLRPPRINTTLVL